MGIAPYQPNDNLSFLKQMFNAQSFDVISIFINNTEDAETNAHMSVGAIDLDSYGAYGTSASTIDWINCDKAAGMWRATLRKAFFINGS